MSETRETRFEVSGGRAGFVRYSSGDRAAQLEWEMLVGEPGMVIYGDACRWDMPKPCQMTRAEVRDVVKELASYLQTRIELSFAGESEVIAPSGGGLTSSCS